MISTAFPDRPGGTNVSPGLFAMRRGCCEWMGQARALGVKLKFGKQKAEMAITEPYASITEVRSLGRVRILCKFRSAD